MTPEAAIAALTPRDRRILGWAFLVSPLGFFLIGIGLLLMLALNWAARVPFRFLGPEYLPFTVMVVVGVVIALGPFQLMLRAMGRLGFEREERQAILRDVWDLWWRAGMKFPKPGDRVRPKKRK